MGNYWTATDDYLREHGGRNPSCPTCGGEMHPIDDHGRFRCFTCEGFGGQSRIRQVNQDLPPAGEIEEVLED